MADGPKLESIQKVITNHDYKVNRQIKIPGDKKSTVGLAYIEGHWTHDAPVFDRMMQAKDTFVRNHLPSTDAQKDKLTYPITSYVHANDHQYVYSPNDKEFIVAETDDANDSFLWSGTLVGSGTRFSIGDSGEFLVEVLQQHKVDKSYFGDGEDEYVGIVERMLQPGQRKTIFNSLATKDQANVEFHDEQFLRDAIKYYGHNLGIEYDYLAEHDSAHNPQVQRGFLAYTRNYFRSLDNLFKTNPEKVRQNLNKMLPIFVSELGYGNDDIDEGNDTNNKHIVQMRSTLKEALGLQGEDKSDLVTHLAGYYGLDKVHASKDIDKLKQIEAAFKPVRSLLETAPDSDLVAIDYHQAYSQAVAKHLNLSKADVEPILKKYIIPNSKINEFKAEPQDNEMEAFLKEMKASTNNAPSNSGKTAETETNAAIKIAKIKSNESTITDRLVASLLEEHNNSISQLRLSGDNDNKAKAIL
ncbi:MAG: hypothetical protein LW817_00630, partial [Candidatus Caenarcaniphilales bacterium]|nr:hypothetical protein [Candidatus Caenarcaniphilales bacterium]